MRSLLAPAFVVVVVNGCICGSGDVIVRDEFGAASETEDVLHTYASSGKVELTIVGVDGFDMERLDTPELSGALSLDPDESVSKGDTINFHALTGEAGEGTIAIVDDAGEEIASRTVTVVDVDDIALSVTAPSVSGFALPEVDPAAVRIVQNGRAAFRTSLFSGGDEVFALDAVESSGRSCIACAEDSCDVVRNAVELSAPFEEEDVVLTAGSATLTVHVIPVADEDVTDLLLDHAAVFDGKESVVASVLAGTDPVFGAPVGWSVDGEVLVNDDDADFPQEGDVLQFKPGGASHAVTASFAGQQAETTAVGSDFEVTSLTFACGAGPAGMAPIVLLLLLRRRRPASQALTPVVARPTVGR